MIGISSMMNWILPRWVNEMGKVIEVTYQTVKTLIRGFSELPTAPKKAVKNALSDCQSRLMDGVNESFDRIDVHVRDVYDRDNGLVFYYVTIKLKIIVDQKEVDSEHNDFGQSPYAPGVPCGWHAGCLSHVTHPCEGCGRIAGHYVVEKNEPIDTGRSMK